MFPSTSSRSQFPLRCAGATRRHSGVDRCLLTCPLALRECRLSFSIVALSSSSPPPSFTCPVLPSSYITSLCLLMLSFPTLLLPVLCFTSFFLPVPSFRLPLPSPVLPSSSFLQMVLSFTSVFLSAPSFRSPFPSPVHSFQPLPSVALSFRLPLSPASPSSHLLPQPLRSSVPFFQSFLSPVPSS